MDKLIKPQDFGAVGNGQLDDTKAIQTMFNAYSDGSTFYFPSGRYIITKGTELKIPNNSVIVTEAPVVFEARGESAKHTLFLIGTNTIIRNLYLQNIGLTVNGNTIYLENIKIQNPGFRGIVIDVSQNIQNKNIVFDNCRVYNAPSHGFMFRRSGEENTSPSVEDIVFKNCYAIDCGSESSPWGTGFCLHNTHNLVKNVLFEDCVAMRSYESGFHCEFAVNVENVNFINCRAIENGVRKYEKLCNDNNYALLDSMYGCGFFVRKGYTFKNCFSNNNVRPIIVEEGFNEEEFKQIDISNSNKYKVYDIFLNKYDSSAVSEDLCVRTAKSYALSNVDCDSERKLSLIIYNEQTKEFISPIESQMFEDIRVARLSTPLVKYNPGETIKLIVDIKAGRDVKLNNGINLGSYHLVGYDKEFNVVKTFNIKNLETVSKEYQSKSYEII